MGSSRKVGRIGEELRKGKSVIKIHCLKKNFEKISFKAKKIKIK